MEQVFNSYVLEFLNDMNWDLEGVIYIPGNVPSLKNSKQIVSIPVKGSPGKRRPMLISSGIVRDYEKGHVYIYNTMRGIFSRELLRYGCVPGERPVVIEFAFIRDSRREFDFINGCQLVQDMMVKSGWLKDDSMKYLCPMFNPEVRVSKPHAGILLRVVA
jgi:hypothetical protein